MMGLGDVIAFFLLLAAIGGAGFFFGSVAQEHRTMRQAYERGLAVECLGRTGYHWECEAAE